MRILILGDIVGRPGRDAALEKLPQIRKNNQIDFAIINVDNAAHGFGIMPGMAEDFFAAGADCLTLGNHGFDKKEIIPHLDKDPRLIRANNYPKTTPGRGANLFALNDGRKILVLHTMGRIFMDPLDDPFARTMEDLRAHTLGTTVQAIVVDIHAEATSEKMAFANFLDGKVSAVVGTHTHAPTADARILPRGTAYQTDLGMCGDYNSVIGFDPAVPIERFVRKMPTDKLSPATGPGTVCGAIIETDDATGHAKSMKMLRLGPILQETVF